MTDKQAKEFLDRVLAAAPRYKGKPRRVRRIVRPTVRAGDDLRLFDRVDGRWGHYCIGKPSVAYGRVHWVFHNRGKWADAGEVILGRKKALLKLEGLRYKARKAEQEGRLLGEAIFAKLMRPPTRSEGPPGGAECEYLMLHSHGRVPTSQRCTLRS